MKLVAVPFHIDGIPVRLVAYDWRADKEFADAEREGILDVLQVTWNNDPDIARGWVGDVIQLADGTWLAGEDQRLGYATPEDAALALVIRDQEYTESLSPEDLERLFQAYVTSLVPLPAVQPTRKP